jgi:hypothetical protein
MYWCNGIMGAYPFVSGLDDGILETVDTSRLDGTGMCTSDTMRDIHKVLVCIDEFLRS